MSAPEWRDRLADALAGRWLSYGDDKGADDLTEHPDRDGARITTTHAPLLAAALLPVVAEIVAEELEARAAMVSARAAEEERTGERDAADALDEVSAWLRAHAAAVRPAASGGATDGERCECAIPGCLCLIHDAPSANLTPGTVWTEAQLIVVRDLLARAVKAEAAVGRVRDLHVPIPGHRDLCEMDGHCPTLAALDGSS